MASAGVQGNSRVPPPNGLDCVRWNGEPYSSYASWVPMIKGGLVALVWADVIRAWTMRNESSLRVPDLAFRDKTQWAKFIEVIDPSRVILLMHRLSQIKSSLVHAQVSELLEKSGHLSRDITGTPLKSPGEPLVVDALKLVQPRGTPPTSAPLAEKNDSSGRFVDLSFSAKGTPPRSKSPTPEPSLDPVNPEDTLGVVFTHFSHVTDVARQSEAEEEKRRMQSRALLMQKLAVAFMVTLVCSLPSS